MKENGMNIVYATDDNYAYLAGGSLLLLLHNCRVNMNIYILDDEISEDNRQKLSSITGKDEFKDRVRLFFVDMKSVIEDVKSKTDKSYGLDMGGAAEFYCL